MHKGDAKGEGTHTDLPGSGLSAETKEQPSMDVHRGPGRNQEGLPQGGREHLLSPGRTETGPRRTL